MKVAVRLLPLKGNVIEDEFEIPIKERPTIEELIKAALPLVRRKMPMAGYREFVNNLSFKEEFKKLAKFAPGDVLTIMELPQSVVMP